jgi:hypothetical protein
LASANEIPPGGEGKIDVHVSTGNSSRKIRQIVRVITNDPKIQEVRLTVTADVQADLDVPRILQFAGKEPATVQATLKNNTNTPVELSAITSSNDLVKVSVSSMTIPANGEVVLSVELLPNFPAGVLDGWIEIKSNLKSMPNVRIRVWGNIQK